MDKQEAKALLTHRLAELRSLPFERLTELLGDERVEETVGASGTAYCLEIDAIWDDRSAGHLRVIASIDDGGLRSIFPITDSFIVARDGSFIGE